MSKICQDYQYHKENQYSRYGGYCIGERMSGKEPLPFHKWQELDNKKLNEVKK